MNYSKSDYHSLFNLNLVLIKKKGLNLKYQGACLVYHEQSSFADISIKTKAT